MRGFKLMLTIISFLFSLSCLLGDVVEAGWEWQNPLPQGNRLFSLWGSSANDVFAVGTAGTIIHFNGTSWNQMSFDTDQYIYDVWGSSANDVFAVGMNETILHYDGSTWTQMASVSGFYNLEGVWDNSANDVFAVGTGGIILHYDGHTWSQMNSGTSTYLSAVWGSSANGGVKGKRALKVK